MAARHIASVFLDDFNNYETVKRRSTSNINHRLTVVNCMYDIVGNWVMMRQVRCYYQSGRAGRGS